MCFEKSFLTNIELSSVNLLNVNKLVWLTLDNAVVPYTNKSNAAKVFQSTFTYLY